MGVMCVCPCGCLLCVWSAYVCMQEAKASEMKSQVPGEPVSLGLKVGLYPHLGGTPEVWQLQLTWQ